MVAAVTPITPIVGGSGSFLAASGSVPASGLETTLSGPWMIEEQSLRSQYVRMPVYGNTSASHSLASPTRGIECIGTHIAHMVIAHYTVKKSYEIFSTSAWTQPQTFQIDALSADPYGNTYGSVGVSAIGPAGTVNTKMPWYFRRYWDATIDTSVTQTCNGTQHFFYQQPEVDATSFQDGSFYFAEYHRVRPGSWMPDTFLSWQDWNYHSYIKPYQLFGAYNTNQESPLQIENYVNGIGDDVTATKFYGLGTEFVVTKTGGLWDPQYTQGCAGYSSTRHNWS